MVFEKVRSIIARQFNIDEKKVTMDTSLDDLRADSLDVAEFLMTLEHEFDIEIEDEKLKGCTTVEQVVEFITGADF